MASRLFLHNDLLTKVGIPYAYFQPPESVKMHYPCIVYNRSRVHMAYADNKTYHFRNAYEVTVIDPNPDSVYVERMKTTFPMTSFLRHFTSDNLNHDVFLVYY